MRNIAECDGVGDAPKIPPPRALGGCGTLTTDYFSRWGKRARGSSTFAT